METHPFAPFVPQNTKFLLLGTFVGKTSDRNDWFYSNSRNQFWPILGEVYGIRLDTKEKKQKLFKKLRMAITDLILSCEREENTNSDGNLVNIVFNIKAISKILSEHKVKTIFFSSHYAKTLFQRQFRDFILCHQKVGLVILPSPSPRYAQMTRVEKAARYKELLPKLKLSRS